MWSQAFLGILRSYAKSFWYVFRVALPLMLLAALLGALVIELLPQQALFAPVSVVGIIVVALVAAFLPVPMAFDVAIGLHRHDQGGPPPLCGHDSLHPGNHQRLLALAIVGKSISWRVAAAAYVTVAGLGTVAGLIVRTLA